MLIDILTHSTRFIVFILLQGLILNNIELSGYINPFLYVLFILTLPLTASKYLVLILSFITGLVIDMFSSTMGFHVAATVFVGFLRPYILKLLEPRDGYEPNYSVNVSDMGLKWFATYTVILVLAHYFRKSFVKYHFHAVFDSHYTIALLQTK